MRKVFLAVDLQNEFASEGGKHYVKRDSIDFLKKDLFPVLRQCGEKVHQIISDYRQPRPGDRDDSCHPGTWGYESIVPKDLVQSTWVKSMNSPVWVRDGIGDSNKQPGAPYPEPTRFRMWLHKNIGDPRKVVPVVFGLTIDCCVLSTLQELNWRGYRPIVIPEGVDHYSGRHEDKEKVLEAVVFNWATVTEFWKI